MSLINEYDVLTSHKQCIQSSFYQMKNNNVTREKQKEDSCAPNNRSSTDFRMLVNMSLPCFNQLSQLPIDQNLRYCETLNAICTGT